MQVSKSYPDREHYVLYEPALLESVQRTAVESFRSAPSIQQLLNQFAALIDADSSLIVQQLQLSGIAHTSQELQLVREQFLYAQHCVKTIIDELEPVLQASEVGEIEQIIALQELTGKLIAALQQLALSSNKWASLLRRSP
jgi:hypothetical protein